MTEKSRRIRTKYYYITNFELHEDPLLRTTTQNIK